MNIDEDKNKYSKKGKILGKLVIWAESPLSGVLEENKSSMVNKKNLLFGN